MEPTTTLAAFVYNQVGKKVLSEGKINIGAMNKVVQVIQQQKGFEKCGSTEAIDKLAASLIETGKAMGKNKALGNFAKAICNMELAEALPFKIRAKLKIASQELCSGEEVSGFKKFTSYCAEALISMSRLFLGKAIKQSTIWKYAGIIEQAQDQKKVTEELIKLRDECTQQKMPKNFTEFVEKLVRSKTAAEVSSAASESFEVEKNEAFKIAERQVKDTAREVNSGKAAYNYIKSLGKSQKLEVAAFLTIASRNARDNKHPELREQCGNMMNGLMQAIKKGDEVDRAIQAAAEFNGEDGEPLLGPVAQRWWEGEETFGIERKGSKIPGLPRTALQNEVAFLSTATNYQELRSVNEEDLNKMMTKELVGKNQDQEKAYLLDLVVRGCRDLNADTGTKFIALAGALLWAKSLTDNEKKFVIYSLVSEATNDATWEGVKEKAKTIPLSGEKATRVGRALEIVLGYQEAEKELARLCAK
jgi:hypothetical protein